jgi:diguanylate cyclase (GGDEF)-like protein
MTLAGGLVAVALAPAAVVLLRLFPPLLPDEQGLGWLVPAIGGAAATLVTVAMLACLERGVRRGDGTAWLRSAALGGTAAGLAVSVLRTVEPGTGAAGFPDGGLAPAAVIAGVLLLAAQLAGRSLPVPGARSPLGWVLLFVVLEGALGAAVLLPRAGDAWPWLLALAAGLTAASAIPGPMLAAGLTAAGLAALAAARPGSVEPIVGLVALAAGALAYAPPPRRVGRLAAAPLPTEAAPAVHETEDDLRAVAAAEEAMRLARELRGTIEELMQARRTVELQRGELAQMARVDDLTGVPTRRAVLERLRIEAAEAQRYRHPVAVVLLDLDGFAAVNRGHGLHVGDEMLREVALRLRLRMRSADALGRVGGDSFLAVLPHTDETGAATFADALRRLLTARPVETSAGELRVSVSIGVAFARAGASLSDEELLAAADEALASARAAGGNRIAFDRAHGLIRLEERRADIPGA